MLDTYSPLAQAIIQRQELLIGPLAWEQAVAVDGLQIQDRTVLVSALDPKRAIDNLVEQFRAIFGQAAVEVSKEAVAPLLVNLSPEQVPELLK